MHDHVLELGEWVQGEHLEAARVEQYSAGYQGSALKMLVIDDVLVDEVATSLARFVSSDEAHFETEYGLFEARPVSAERWRAADPSARFYHYGALDQSVRGTSADATRFFRFLDAIQTPAFRAYFETIIGMPLGVVEAPTVHATGAQDFLSTHNDRSHGRRIAVVLYLTPDWPPGHGGALRMFSSAGSAAIDPRFNRMVVFDVHQHWGHRVGPLTADAGDRRRMSVGWWIADPEVRNTST